MSAFRRERPPRRRGKGLDPVELGHFFGCLLDDRVGPLCDVGAGRAGRPQPAVPDLAGVSLLGAFATQRDELGQQRLRSKMRVLGKPRGDSGDERVERVEGVAMTHFPGSMAGQIGADGHTVVVRGVGHLNDRHRLPFDRVDAHVGSGPFSDWCEVEDHQHHAHGRQLSTQGQQYHCFALRKPREHRRINEPEWPTLRPNGVLLNERRQVGGVPHGKFVCLHGVWCQAEAPDLRAQPALTDSPTIAGSRPRPLASPTHAASLPRKTDLSKASARA